MFNSVTKHTFTRILRALITFRTWLSNTKVKRESTTTLDELPKQFQKQNSVNIDHSGKEVKTVQGKFVILSFVQLYSHSF